MARGGSGRIVLEIEPSEKEELYAAVIKDGMTLKEWFLRKASDYLRERKPFGPQILSEAPVAYRTTKKNETKSKASKLKKPK